MVWDTSTPLGSEARSQGDDRIRELKTDVQTALRGNTTEGDEAVFPGSDTSNPVYRYRGLKGTEVARPAAGEYGLYVNDDKRTLQRDNGVAWQDIAQLMPAGIILPYGGTSAPYGFLLCNGAAVSRTTYADLFAVVGENFGEGDGNTTFNLPDLRGRFIRGRDNGTARDPDAAGRTAMAAGGNTGDAVGSIQDDATAKNGLALTDPTHSHVSAIFTASSGADLSRIQAPAGNVAQNNGSMTGQASSTGITLGNGDSETRPANASVEFVIKY
jgi:microcystin-dependent protein